MANDSFLIYKTSKREPISFPCYHIPSFCAIPISARVAVYDGTAQCCPLAKRIFRILPRSFVSEIAESFVCKFVANRTKISAMRTNTKLGLIFYHEEGGNRSFRNVCTSLSIYRCYTLNNKCCRVTLLQPSVTPRLII